MKSLRIISPVYNEKEVIGEFVSAIGSVVQEATLQFPDWKLTLLLVDDGSADAISSEVASHALNLEVQIIRLSKNYGHQPAVWCGLEFLSDDEYCVVLDSDLQDPPRYILNILGELEEGLDVVLMSRVSRNDSFQKRFFATLYYKMRNLLVEDTGNREVGDFFALSPRALAALLAYSERVKYIRGLIPLIGFRVSYLEFHRESRRAGKTHYSVSKMLSLALSGIVGFSIKPLILVVYLGFLGTVLSILFICYVFWIKQILGVSTPPGWAFLSVITLVMSAMQLLSIGVISLYVARLIDEVKNRPIYNVESSITLSGGDYD
jgi:glycosyltransferase involved in cell wall biosynthesis